MALTFHQKRIADSTARFNVIATGRRCGKTHIIRRKCCKVAAQIDKNVAYVAPTYKMAKRIAWKRFKYKLMQLNWLDGKPNESDLILNLRSGSSIQLFGAENFDAMRGLEFDHIGADEFAYQPLEAWEEVMRATLANRVGTADFASSPDGRNHFYDFYQRGLSDDPKWKDWAAYHFTTAQGGLVPLSEINAAKDELDPLTFQQEYEASFVNFTGRAYYTFSEQNYGSLRYDADDDLIFCFDFNTAPGVAAIVQEQYLPSPSGLFGTGVIDEVYIPQGSNTMYVCERLIEKYQNHKGRVLGYGDATGGNKVPSSLMGSDWEIIDNMMSKAFPNRWIKRVQRKNPLERARVNAMNSRVKTLGGQIRLMVDPAKAPYTVKDFEGTKILEGSNGQIDKTKNSENSKLTHLTDAIGYYVHQEFSGDYDVRSIPFRVV